MPTHLIQQQQQLRASPAHICCSKIINLLTPNEQNPLHDPICSKVWVTQQTNKHIWKEMLEEQQLLGIFLICEIPKNIKSKRRDKDKDKKKKLSEGWCIMNEITYMESGVPRVVQSLHTNCQQESSDAKERTLRVLSNFLLATTQKILERSFIFKPSTHDFQYPEFI